MNVAVSWLKELVDLNISIDELIELLPLRTIGLKDINPESLELDMKGYNRSDLLSLRGVALEVAAITDSKIRFEDIASADLIWIKKSLPKVAVSVENQNLVPVYCIAKIEGLKVEDSNSEWVSKLNNSEIRAVNNVADVTNLIMVEYGQPLHAFDASQVKNENIVVRMAKTGEKLLTLDNKTRELEESDILITDSEKILGLAGVMGGKESEVTDKTSTILLEAAIFDPGTLRRTSQRLSLTSEASKRFYHGLTKKRLFQALDAAIKMYEGLGGKLTGITIVGDSEESLNKVPLSLQKTQDLIGIEIEKEKVEDYLKRLGFELESSEKGWVVTPPFYRGDIKEDVDVIEEVARIYGYENIPSKSLEGALPEDVDQKIYNLIFNMKNELVNLGLTEVSTYSYHSTQVLDFLGQIGNKDDYLIKIKNPMSKETEYMRASVWANLIEVVGKNARAGFDDIAIFEVGKVYNKEASEIKERYVLSVALMNGTDNPVSELSNIFNKLLDKLNLNISAESGEVPAVVKSVFHPKRFLNISKDSELIGGMSEVHLRVLDKLGIQKRVAIFEINLENLI